MNRQQRRRQAAMARHDRFFNERVKHLPEVGPEALGKPGVHHMAMFHDEWCGIYDGKACNCSPQIKYYAEPDRN